MRIDWRIINSVTLTSIDLDALLQNAQRFDCSTFQTEISRLEREEACPPRQNSCRVIMMLNLGATRGRDVTFWRSI